MLLSKQPGDTGIYATATAEQVRLYYVLDRVLPFVSGGAAAAEAAGVLRGESGCAGLEATLPDALSVAHHVSAAPACVPREHLRMLYRLSATGTGASRTGGVGAAPAAAVAASPPLATSPPYASALSAALGEAGMGGGDEQRGIDDAAVAAACRWGSPLIPFHTVPCAAAGAGSNSDVSRPYARVSQEWATPVLGSVEDSGPFGGEGVAAHDGGSASHLTHLLSSAGRDVGGHVYATAATGPSPGSRVGRPPTSARGVLSSAAVPTSLSMSCATDCLLFFVSNSEGHSWIGRSDATALSPLRVSTATLQGRRNGGPAANVGGSGRQSATLSYIVGGPGTAASSSPRPPRPFSSAYGATGNASFRTHSFASSERAATPPNTIADDDALPGSAALLDSDDDNKNDGAAEEGEDVEEEEGGSGGRGAGAGRVGSAAHGRRHGRRGSSTGAAPAFPSADGLEAGLAGVPPLAVTSLPSGRVFSRHDRVVTASGWDPRNSAILALGRQGGVVQLLDVEYMIGSAASTRCSSTTSSAISDDTAEPFTASAHGAARTTTSGGGPRFSPYAGADHLSYSVIQQREMVGPVTALDWMPQSHLTVVAARRRDGLGCYAELLDLRASRDGVTYLGAPPEVFGVPVYARGAEGASPSVLCSAEHVACHPSQRYVATVGTARVRGDIVQLWDVRMATRPVAYHVYARAGYTSLCWSAAETGVVLGTTRDGSLRGHFFKEVAGRGGGGVLPTASTAGAAAAAALASAASHDVGRSHAASGGGPSHRGRRRRGHSSGPQPHLLAGGAGGGAADLGERWGSGANAAHNNGGYSGTEAEVEEDFMDDSGSFRSGLSLDGIGTAPSSTTEGSNALVHVNVRAQSALKCRLPSRVPAAAVAWVCRPVSEIAAAAEDKATGVVAKAGAAAATRVAGAMERGCRTDLPQLLLMNAKNGELYTQVYNPQGGLVTILNQSMGLVGVGPNAFIARPSAAYKTATYVHEERMLQALERKAALLTGLAAGPQGHVAAAGASGRAATAGASRGASSSATSTPPITATGAAASSPAAINRASAAASAPAGNSSLLSDGSGTGGVLRRGREKSGHSSSSATTAASLSRGGVAAGTGRRGDRPVDLIGLGLLDEEDDEEEEEEEEDEDDGGSAGSARGGADSTDLEGNEDRHRAEATRARQGAGDAGDATADGRERVNASSIDADGAERREGGAAAVAPNRRPSSLSPATVAASGGAAAAAAAGRSRDALRAGEPSLSGLGVGNAGSGTSAADPRTAQRNSPPAGSSPARTPSSSPAAASRPMSPLAQILLPREGSGGAATPAIERDVPLELSYCQFHRVDRARLIWRRLRSGFSLDPVRNLRVLLHEGIDREAFATFLYGCCASALLHPSSASTTTAAAQHTAALNGAAANTANAPFSVVLGARRAVPGMLELLASERRLRAQYGLRDTRLSHTFRLPTQPSHTGVVVPEGAAVAGSASSSPTPPPSVPLPTVAGAGPLGFAAPLLPSLAGAADRGHKGPPGFFRSPFEAAAATMRGGLPGAVAPPSAPSAAQLRPGTHARAAGSSQGHGGAAGEQPPTHTAAVGRMRELILQSVGWLPPPPPFDLDGQRKAGQGSAAPLPSSQHHQKLQQQQQQQQQSPPRHPAERFFVQGDGIGQRSLQEALERRVTVLVLLDRLEDAAELLSLHSHRNPQYPSIALTLSAARGPAASLLSLASPSSSGVTFWMRLLLTYVELLMRQQHFTQGVPPVTTAPMQGGVQSGAASTPLTSDGADGPSAEQPTRFDALFPLAEQRTAVTLLLKGHPRLSMPDKIGLATALLLPPHYHGGHVDNLSDVLQTLVLQQYRACAWTGAWAGASVPLGDVSVSSMAGAGGGAAAVSTSRPASTSPYVSPAASPAPPATAAGLRMLPQPQHQQQRRTSAPLTHSAPPLMPPPTQDAPATARPVGRATMPEGVAAPAELFAPIGGCSLLLVAAVECSSADSRALQRYVDEGGDVQTTLCYATAFAHASSSTVRVWREAYRQQLNEQGLSMWRSQLDLQCIKLLRQREEADREAVTADGRAGGAMGGGGSSAGGGGGGIGPLAGGLAGPGVGVDGSGGAGGSLVSGGVGGGHELLVGSGGVLSAGGAGGVGLLGAGKGVPKGFPAALGDLSAAPPSSAAAMMSTQTAMMMKRTLKGFAQTTATTAADRDRGLRDGGAATAGARASAGVDHQHHRTVELRCNCGQAMHATALGKSALSTMASTNVTRRQLIPCGNPECRQWQTPMCAVCGERMEHRATELPPDRFFAWCSVCLHGGHWCHLRQWFCKHTKCPVENCPCHCCDNTHLT